jgi:hypothetical protein
LARLPALSFVRLFDLDRPLVSSLPEQQQIAELERKIGQMAMEDDVTRFCIPAIT